MAGYFSTPSSFSSIPPEKFEDEDDDAYLEDDNSSVYSGSLDCDAVVKEGDKAPQLVTAADTAAELSEPLLPRDASLPSPVFVTPAQSLISNNERGGSRSSSRASSFTGHRGISADPAVEKIHDATAETFQVRSVLGKGSFGTVYKVAEKATGKSFAMKVLQKEAIFSQGILRYAVTEKNVQAAMSHPFIVGLVCAFQTPHELVLVMPFCGGGTLEKLVKGQGGLPEEMARLYFAEIFLAIEHVHRHDVAYRDLKCENIVLDDLGHAMLTDFGLSKENIVGQGTTDTFVGSVAFIPPEILKSQRHGKPVDVYGLGVVLFEMLTTLPPFYNENKEEMFTKIKDAPLDIPSFVSEECASMLCDCLDRNPENRPTTSTRSISSGGLGIRHHTFMAPVDFDALLRREAPVMKPESRRPPNKPANADAIQPFKVGRRGQKVDGWEYPLARGGGALGRESPGRCGCFHKLIGIEST